MLKWFHRPDAAALRNANDLINQRESCHFDSDLINHIHKDKCARCALRILELPNWAGLVQELRALMTMSAAVEQFGRQLGLDTRRMVSSFFPDQKEIYSKPEDGIAVNAKNGSMLPIKARFVRRIEDTVRWVDNYSWVVLAMAQNLELDGLLAREFHYLSLRWLLTEVIRLGDFPDSLRRSMPEFIARFREATMRAYAEFWFSLTCEYHPDHLPDPPPRRHPATVDAAFSDFWRRNHLRSAVEAAQIDCPDSYPAFSRYVIQRQGVNQIARALKKSTWEVAADILWKTHEVASVYQDRLDDDSSRPFTDEECNAIVQLMESEKDHHLE